jgi:hypothetical protein
MGDIPKPASAIVARVFLGRMGQQIRCNSGADGIVRMKENGISAGLAGAACHCASGVIAAIERSP